jgi:hypothetical protein
MLNNVIADPVLQEIAEYVIYAFAVAGAYVTLMGLLWICQKVTT